MKLAAIATLAALAAPVFAQVDNNRVIAVINGEEIKGSEYYRRMEFLPDVGKFVGNEFVSSTPGFWTLERLITERLIASVAKERNLTPSPTDVQSEIQNRLKANPDMMAEWLASGQTQAEFDRQVFLQLCQFKIATAGVLVTDVEVEKFYKDYPTMFTTPKMHKLRVISVSDDVKKAQVDLQLQSGKKFADVAKELSEDITKLDGGYYGTIDLMRVNELVRKSIEAIKVGGTTAWIENGPQRIKFYLEDVIPERKQPLTDDLKRSIRRRLMLEKGKNKNDVPKIMSEARKRMKLDIKSKDLADEYERIMKRFEPPTTINPE